MKELFIKFKRGKRKILRESALTKEMGFSCLQPSKKLEKLVTVFALNNFESKGINGPVFKCM
jgi:hypothetical protein